MKEIRISEEVIKHDGHEYAKGVQTVPDELAAYFCARAWAESTDGSIPTGERSKEAVVINPDNLTQATK